MTRALRLERRIDARPETVFSYLTDPRRYMRWMGVDAQLDPQPGGIYRVTVPQGFVALGEFVEIDPPHRVVFTWGWEGDSPVPPGSSRVEITLTPDGHGTLLRLTHTGLPDDEAVQLHKLGWDRYLDRLATAAGGGDPGPDAV
jgi:uncharacterized protein YndB with AHSA1/START domain